MSIFNVKSERELIELIYLFLFGGTTFLLLSIFWDFNPNCSEKKFPVLILLSFLPSGFFTGRWLHHVRNVLTKLRRTAQWCRTYARYPFWHIRNHYIRRMVGILIEYWNFFLVFFLQRVLFKKIVQSLMRKKPVSKKCPNLIIRWLV